MPRNTSTLWRTALGSLSGLALAALAAGAAAAPQADDLAVVKKAVAENQAPATTPPAAARPGLDRVASKKSPQWLRVRVVEKGSKKGRISINLPLAVVRAIGDLNIDLGRCRHGRDHDLDGGKETDESSRKDRCDLRVGDILAALEAGEELVEVDREDTTVRVWVE